MGDFDDMMESAQSVVYDAMGSDASWTPSNGGDAITGRVLYNEPTKEEGVAGIEYEAESPWMEYMEGEFDGLWEAVRSNKPETIIVNGRSFVTLKKGSRKFDGKTIIIYLKEL